jgi:hypothetical protein
VKLYTNASPTLPTSASPFFKLHFTDASPKLQGGILHANRVPSSALQFALTIRSIPFASVPEKIIEYSEEFVSKLLPETVMS